MSNPAYYRKQAEVFASLALANTSSRYMMERYTALAEKFLAKAEEAELSQEAPPPAARRQHGGNDMDRD